MTWANRCPTIWLVPTMIAQLRGSLPGETCSRRRWPAEANTIPSQNWELARLATQGESPLPLTNGLSGFYKGNFP